MKIILSTLNAKFIHSSLSIRYLQEYVRDIQKVEIQEYTINQNIDFIVSELYDLNPDILGFSTYIWNVEEILKISQAIKIVKPDIKILLGGPEVSYDSLQTMKENPHIDYIIFGEGEETFREFVEKLIKEDYDMEGVQGLTYREGEEIRSNLPRPLMHDLDRIPSPYSSIKNEFKNKIVYFESSRGCPFNCKFCLSSTIKGVRYFSIDRVKRDLDNLIDSGVDQVKFVDRTFNEDKEYSMEVMSHIISRKPKNMNFHFEVTAHLLDDEMLDFLSEVKEGLFQFEIGVQSSNLETIRAIGRATNLDKLEKVSKTIKSYRNIHQHLDLIAGLPYEDYESFKKSFNYVYNIRPEKIQLGFLKLLKGSELRDDEEKYGFKYLDSPPYEVLETDWIKYKDIIKLKRIEELVERYYNEKYFKHSLEYLMANIYDHPFEFFETFSEYWIEKNHHQYPMSRTKLYQVLGEYYKYKGYDGFDIFKEILRFDFISNNKSSKMPELIRNREANKKKINIHRVLKDYRLLDNELKEYKNIPTKNMIRHVKIESFSVDVLNIIQNDYIYKEGAGEPRDIIFLYKDNVINRFSAFDITEITKGLV